MGTKRNRGLARFKASHLPTRIVTGAFILDSGLTKRGADTETAGQLHEFAAGTYPSMRKLEPQRFARLLSAGEIALGAALLAPVVPTAVAGAGLVAFSTGLLGLYARTPGMRQEGSIRPTSQGMSLAKDVWLLAIGSALVLDDLIERRNRKSAHSQK